MKNYLQPGDRIALLASQLVFPAHAAGDTYTTLVGSAQGLTVPINQPQGGDPVVCGTLIGVVNNDALQSTDTVIISTKGVFTLSCVAKHAGGVNDAIAAGDLIYIDGSTAVLNKDTTKTPFGIALGTVGAGATGAIAVKLVQASSVAAVTVNAGPTDAVTAAVASAAIPIASGSTSLGSGGALAMTLATPSTPADDGKRIFIVAATAHAHTVTTAANVVKNANASGDTLTFAHVGDSVELEAIGGLWYVRSINGPVLSEV